MRKLGIWLCVIALCVVCGGCGAPSEPTDVPTAPSAASTTAPTAPSEDERFTVAIGEKSGKIGETILLPLTVTAGSGLAHADMFLHYDATRLKLIRQYDEETDAYMVAKPQLWEGNVYAEETEAGTLRLMLVTGGDGLTESGTLCTIAFELLKGESGTCAVELSVPVCGVNDGGEEDIDAVATGRLQTQDGKIIVIK